MAQAHPASAVAVLGAGAWGTALAIRIALNGHPVRLWGRDAAAVDAMLASRRNVRYLPGIELPASLAISADLDATLSGVRDVLIATPTGAFGAVLDAAVARGGESLRVAWACKGYEHGSGRLLHEVVCERLGAGAQMALVSGPTFAAEVARQLPTAVTLAASHPDLCSDWRAYLHATSFRVYTTDDLIGVEIGGAVKNVLAIAAGVADGLGFGANARAALVARGLQEIIRLGAALGARQDTLLGLSGLGDLVLTATDNQSRNRRFGLAIGAGATPGEAATALGALAEGAQAALEVRKMATRLGIELPIMAQVAAIMDEQITPRAAVSALLARTPGTESRQQ